MDATQFCNKPLDFWLNQNLVQNTFVQWDFDSMIPSINFLYSSECNNDYFKIDIDLKKLDKGYTKISKLFKKNLLNIKDSFLQKQEKTIGKSSNNTIPKMGVKAIANSFQLMNESVDSSFIELLQKVPYFKLTWKYKNNHKNLELTFKKDSKLLKLLGV